MRCFHLIVAAVLTAHIGLLGVRVVRRFFRFSAVDAASACAGYRLIGVQICLGAGTWLTHYGPPAALSSWFSDKAAWLARYTVEAGSVLQTHVTTAHVAVGSLILGTSVALGVAIAAVAASHAGLARR